MTSYRVTGPGVDQVVSGLTVTIPPALLTLGTINFTVQSRYGTTPWLSTGVSHQVDAITSLLVNCVPPDRGRRLAGDLELLVGGHDEARQPSSPRWRSSPRAAR